MKTNRKISLIAIALILAFSLSFTAIASTAAAADDETIERGVAWEMLNNEYYIMQDMLGEIGNDFTDYYYHTIRSAAQVAGDLIESPSSTTAQLKEMTEQLSFLRSERNNPANHARVGYYTVAFTNNGSWSDPIYVYNWSDDGGEIFPWPGETMMGGYTNEFGQKQYYTFVPMDVPNIVISSNQLIADGEYTVVPTVRVQTVDITVIGNTGYYLTGARDGAKYKVGTWELKDPDYPQYIPVDPITPDPTTASTEAPTEAPTDITTQAPTAAPTQNPTVKANLPTEPPTEFNIDDYLPKSDAMLEFYEHSIEDPNQEALRQTITSATSLLAPGNAYTPEYIEKISRVRNFAVKVYNDARSADHELIGARHMLQAAIEDKSYEEIVAISRQWFYMAETVDPDPTPSTEPSAEKPTDGVWANDPITDHLIGDADDDGSITVLDTTRIQRILADFDPEKRPKAERYASITGDRLNILDATMIQRHLAGYEMPYRIGEHFPAV